MTRTEFGDWIAEASRLYPQWQALAEGGVLDAIFRRLAPIALPVALDRLRAERSANLDAAVPAMEAIAIETRGQRADENRNPPAIRDDEVASVRREHAALRRWLDAQTDATLAALRAAVLRRGGFTASALASADPRRNLALATLMRREAGEDRPHEIGPGIAEGDAGAFLFAGRGNPQPEGVR